MRLKLRNHIALPYVIPVIHEDDRPAVQFSE